jgi:Fic family protein
VRGRNKACGQFRKIQNWIGAPGCTVEEADFVPPEPGSLMGHLDNWEKYYHSDRPDPLVQLAVIHAQFEIVHPFLSQPMFYLSDYLEERRDEYVGRLRALGGTPEGWNRWIEFFLTALDEQARRNADKARALIAQLFARPIFQSTHIRIGTRKQPSRQSIAQLLRTLREAGILHVLREASGRRAQILAFADLLAVAEGRGTAGPSPARPAAR